MCIRDRIYPVIRKDKGFKIFNKELINIWELRKKISSVNSDVKSRINPKLKVFDLICSGLYGKYCKVSIKSEIDVSLVEQLLKKMMEQSLLVMLLD